MEMLIKDYIEDRIVFYWQNKKAQRISPILPCLQHAKEWLIDHYVCRYKGTERRCSKIDRRSFHKQSAYLQLQRNPYTQGRRITDRELKAEIDLANQKISLLILDSLSLSEKG
ncbi:hypothetical protein ACMXYW_00470 [Neptuniibacter sp. QD48_55]|uniref:hypothetical protein n=1 Tax=Neptuniibacter sp. QD48_55 TaxID=3398212 RepID=UPI0039F4CE48